MSTDGGGWTVFQRRHNKSVNFYRGWKDYKNGFGNLDGNFWLGLDKIHRLTKSGQNVLRIDMMDWTQNTAFAKYGSFSVASELNFYKLQLSGFSGKVGLYKHIFPTFYCQTVNLEYMHTKFIAFFVGFFVIHKGSAGFIKKVNSFVPNFPWAYP